MCTRTIASRVQQRHNGLLAVRRALPRPTAQRLCMRSAPTRERCRAGAPACPERGRRGSAGGPRATRSTFTLRHVASAAAAQAAPGSLVLRSSSEEGSLGREPVDREAIQHHRARSGAIQVLGLGEDTLIAPEGAPGRRPPPPTGSRPRLLSVAPHGAPAS